MKQTFAQIATLARALPHTGIGGLNNRIQQMVDFAELNANETIYLDKAATADQFDALALATLESNLCFCEDMAVCQWFAENDVAW